MSNKFESAVLKIIKGCVENINNENVIESRKKIQGFFSELPYTIFNKNFIFAYGTLRRDQEQYKQIKVLFGDKSIEYIYTTKYDYYKIVDLGPCPALLDSSSPDFVMGDVIYVSDEVFAYIKEKAESEGFIQDDATLWVPAEKITNKNVKVMYLPTFVAGDKLIKEVEDNKLKYPKIEVCDWVRYQKQTKPYLTEEEKYMQQLLWNEYQCWD